MSWPPSCTRNSATPALRGSKRPVPTPSSVGSGARPQGAFAVMGRCCASHAGTPPRPFIAAPVVLEGLASRIASCAPCVATQGDHPASRLPPSGHSDPASRKLIWKTSPFPAFENAREMSLTFPKASRAQTKNRARSPNSFPRRISKKTCR
eukprot:scaffold193803_cov32-Tisochrysis_lutea.AAC.4